MIAMSRREETRGHKLYAQRMLRIACASFLFSSVCASAETPPRATSGNVDRRVIEELTPPWGSVGQVNVGGYRRRTECTGSLIAANVVITAAHCVMDPWRRQPFSVGEIHFLAGVRQSKWLGHSTAKCLHFLPGYEYVDHSFSRDIVLITLNDNLNDIAPLELDRTEVQSSDVSLVHAAYPADRRYVLTAQFGCHLIKGDQSLWLTDCDARPASSGGPVFIQMKEGPKLAAIMVGVGPSGSIAVPIANWLDVLGARHCP
jgi:protease YdgD